MLIIYKIKYWLQLFFRIFGYQVTKNFRIQKLYKKNVFKTKNKKRVLLSYITRPFTVGIDYTHTNQIECYTAAEIFKFLGYDVDVIDYNLNKKINYYKYDVIYGMGHILEESFYKIEQPGPLRIFYATGCSTFYSDIASTLKVRQFYQKHKRYLLESSRIIRKNQVAQTLLSDAVIILGNDFVLNTYLKYDPNGYDRYFQINPFYLDSYNLDLNKKNFSEARKNFLWFGSGGLLHKGLDLLLDIFSNRNDINLHICGDLSKEKGFFNYYKDIILNAPNITYHGFVNIKSNLFKTIINTCGYVVFPSVSEGGSPSVLTTIANGGLIPIITKASGLDVDKIGWILDEPNIHEFERIINIASNMDKHVLKEKSSLIKTYVRKKYSYNNYRNNLKEILTKILINAK